ncbi:MAG: hypothetical protein GY711_34650 [bacterium]|nr:hypothetical protein [bacterium]
MHTCTLFAFAAAALCSTARAQWSVDSLSVGRRDVAATSVGSTSNTTNALAVTFETPGDPAVQFAVTQRSVFEDTTLLEVSITLSQRVDHDVSVSYSLGGTATVNVDWRVEEPNPFVIPARARRADMTLLVAEDSTQEGNETGIVTLTGATGAVLGTASTMTLTILDDD